MSTYKKWYSHETITKARALGCRWIATDENGAVWGYTLRPDHRVAKWRCDRDEEGMQFLMQLDSDCPDWKESLMEITE